MGVTASAELMTETFALYPGLEEMITTGFMCLKDDDQSTQTVEKLEPFVRHVIQCCGMVETLARFCSPNGTIDLAYLKNRVDGCPSMSNRNNVSLNNLKKFICVMIQHLFVLQKEDAETWRNDMSTLMQEQTDKYQLSMKMYKQSYINQIKSHHKEVDESYKMEEEFATKWNGQVELQEAIAQQQHALVQKMNEESGINFDERKRVRRERFLQGLQDMTHSPTITSDGVRKYSFVYPANLTTSGGPLSVGSGTYQVNNRKG